ncbi:hypothetical protein [Segatella oris]|uniref:hypothetical protein n=1 Tax=Segatella oris TaxID=28135 RepID=UPI0028EC6A81|nr:hypothetical protein [Segatella oris]
MSNFKQSPVIFDEAAHTYTLEGVRLSGVTAIVKWMFPDTYKDIPQSVLEKAAEHGSLIHKKCEQYDNCGFGDDLQEVREYVRLKAENGLTTLENEYLVDDGKDIASSIDVVFDKDESGMYSLADIKTTSKIHKDNVTLQLSIYAYLFEKCNKGKKVGRLFVIWLPKEQYGKAELMELKRIGSADCKKIVKAYVAKEDATPYREKYFGVVEASTEIEPIEEAMPANLKDAEDEIIKIETQLKQMEERKKELKEGLYDLMVQHNVKKWQSKRLQIIRKLESTRESIDTAKVKKQHPEVYAECLKTSKVKGSITINIL